MRSLVATLLLAVPLPASAQEAPASAPPVVQSDPAAWQAAFEAARAKLLSGEFQAAAEGFEPLIAGAPTPVDRAVAQSLRDLAVQWHTRGYVFVAQKDLGESELSSKAVDQRSGAEIATLYTAAVGYGVASGAYLAVLTEPESAAGFTLPTLGLAAAAAGGVYLADNPKRLRYGTPTAIGNGLILGLLEGTLWTTWYQAQARYTDELSSETAATLIWAPMTAGAVAGGIIGEAVGTTPGRAEMLGVSGSFGAAFTALMLQTITEPGEKQDDRILLGAALAANAGAVGGYFLGREWQPSVSRVRFIGLGGLSGTLVASLLYISFEEADPRAFGAVTATGMAGGLVVAAWLTDGMAPDERRDESAGASAQLLLAPAPGGATLGAAGVF